MRHAREAPRWLRAIERIALVMLVGWAAAWLSATATPRCEREVRSGDRRRGVDICLASYERTRDDQDLAWAAQLYLELGELDQAERLAHRILDGHGHGPRHGDAHRILSYVMFQRGLGSAARMHARIALSAHTSAGDTSGMTSDALLLSQAAWQLGDFTAALDAADQALQLAQSLRNRPNEVAAYLARADALVRMGDTRGAIVTLTSAIERTDDPCDQAWARLKLGMCRMDAKQDDLALVELAAAARANARCRAPAVASSIAINQAWLLRWSDPPAALARLDDIAKSGPEGMETLLLRGYLAADRGAIEQSDRYLARAAVLEPPDADWPWEIARAQAELAELRGGLGDDRLAELHYRRATAMVAALRASARSRSAYLVASHRGPYDGLIALLARQGRWRDALGVVLDLDASDMLRATADERMVRDRASEASLPRVTMTSPATVEDVVAAWRPRDLVIVIAPSRRAIGPGRERAYRLQITGGQVTGEDVGDARAAQRWADALFADPGDRVAARALGRMMVPAGRASGTLHVLAIGSLGKVPLAALRDDDGALVIARRPLVKVLALRTTRPEATGAGPAVVIADPRGNLPSARVEGAMVAGALGASAQVSGAATPVAATRSQLWATGDASLLHIAGHVGARGRWRALHLADGEVDPAEIVQRGLAPRLAVLAGCGSAAAMDEEGWGSIAAALLESGTATVIATDRSVGDDAALAVMRSFYAQPDWRTDPARALARVQQAQDRQTTSRDDVTGPPVWAAFSALGRPPIVPARRSAVPAAHPGAGRS